MAGQKFTPYATTSLPSAINRDPFGIYLIRTVDGFKLYAIADTPGKEAVELKVDGYVDLTTDQTVDGNKTFQKPIGLTEQNILPSVPNGQAKVQCMNGTYGGQTQRGVGIIATFGTGKNLFLDFMELAATVTRYAVRKLSDPVIEKSTFMSKNYLGFKKEFYAGSSISLSSGWNTIDIANTCGWDDGDALLQGMQWDVVWNSGTESIPNIKSLKSHIRITDNTDIYIAKQSGTWVVRINLTASMTISANSKLVVW